MLDASQKVVQYVENETQDTLKRDEKLALALVRLIEIIGEAASRVSPEKQADLPQIPWKEMIGMRNRIVHAYFDIDYNVVWDTATFNIPSLIETLTEVLDSWLTDKTS
ncbi:MAG: DUF86 domain-containing protein [Leptolyngbya sp.]|nr:DUF86 domain-containing protein [Leptolyngbya sp.]